MLTRRAGLLPTVYNRKDAFALSLSLSLSLSPALSLSVCIYVYIYIYVYMYIPLLSLVALSLSPGSFNKKKWARKGTYELISVPAENLEDMDPMHRLRQDDHIHTTRNRMSIHRMVMRSVAHFKSFYQP